jgi:hypothetical protein
MPHTFETCTCLDDVLGYFSHSLFGFIVSNVLYIPFEQTHTHIQMCGEIFLYIARYVWGFVPILKEFGERILLSLCMDQ